MSDEKTEGEAQTNEMTEGEAEQRPPTGLEIFRAAKQRCRDMHGWPNTLEEEIEFRHQFRLGQQVDALERIACALERFVDAAINTTRHGTEYVSVRADTYEQNL
jgi:hypothetical protein